MSEIIASSVIKVGVDSSEATAGLAKIDDGAAKTGRTLEDLGVKASKSTEKVSAGSDAAAKKTEIATKNMIGSIQRTTAALEAGSRSNSKYYETLANQRGVNVEALKPYLAQLDAVSSKQDVVNKALRSTDPAVQQLGLSAKQTAFALRGIPAQFTDIATSLQAGQAPLTVLLQQGGQLKDMFGGIGPAAKAMGGYVLGLVNPFTVAAVALGGLAYAAYRGNAEFNELNATLKMTGGYTGKTVQDLDDMAKQLTVTGTKISVAKEAIQALLATGKVSGDQLQDFGRAAIDMAKDTGKSISDVVKGLSDLGDDPVKWIEKYNEQYHTLTAQQYLLAKGLAEVGDKAGATRVVLDSLRDAHTRMYEGASKQVGFLQKFYEDWSRGIDKIGEALKSIGRPDTNAEKINSAFTFRAQLETQLQSAEKYGDQARVTYLKNQLDANKAIINALRDKVDAEKEVARVQQETATKAVSTINLNKYLDDNKYADKKTKYALEVKAENKAFAEAVKGFETTSKEYEDALRRHKSNLAQIQQQNATQEESAIDKLIKKIKQQTEETLAQAAQNDKITNGQKNRIALNEMEASSVGKIAKAKIDAAEKGIASQLSAEAALKDAETQKDVAKYLEQSTIARKASSAQLAIEYDLYGKASESREIAMIAIKEQADLEKFLAKTKDEGRTLSISQIENLEADTQARIMVSQATLAQAKALDYAAQLAQANQRYTAATTGSEEDRIRASLEIEADVWRQRIDNAAKAGKEVQDILQSQFDTWYANQKKEMEFTIKINGLHDIADGFESISKASANFGKSLKGVSTALGGIGGAFRDIAKAEQKAHDGRKGAEADRIGAYGDMADAAKGFFDENSKGYKTLDGMAKAFHTAQMAMQAIEMGKAAIAAVMNQAKGDPYTAWARMAAMAAAMAALGYAVGGGFSSSTGDGTSAAERQRTQGTGTVLGDAAAKSESISKSLEELRDNSDMSLPISQSMLASLQGIEAAMTGLAQIVFRTAGISSGNGLGITESSNPNLPGWGSTAAKYSSYGFMDKFTQNSELQKPLVDMVNRAIGNLFGKTTQTITDSGLSISGALGDVRQGLGVSQYANVQTESRSLFGLSRSTSNSTVFGAVDATISDQIGKVFSGIADTLIIASSTFTSDTDGIRQQIEDFAVNIPKISLRGLTGDALQEALNAVFSSFSDTLASTVIPGMEDFQNVGEGYFQTLVRIVSGVEAGQAALERFGIAAIDFEEIINKQGNVGAEIVRQSLLNVEVLSTGVLTGVGKIIEGFDGSVSDLAEAYQSLLDVRKLMAATNLNGLDLSASTIQGAGGLSELTSGLSAYLDKFFTPEEKAKAQVKDVSDQFAKLGITMPTTLAAFRELVGSIDTSSDAGAKLAGSIIALADPFATALESATDGLNDMVSSLTSFRDSLVAGANSNLDPISQTAAARAALNRAYTSSLAGDATATASIESLAQAFLTASKASSVDARSYSRDLASVISMVNNVIKTTETQQTIAMAMVNQPPNDVFIGQPHSSLTKDASSKLPNQEPNVSNDEVIRIMTEVSKGIDVLTQYTKKTADTLVRVTRDGESMVTEAAE